MFRSYFMSLKYYLKTNAKLILKLLKCLWSKLEYE